MSGFLDATAMAVPDIVEIGARAAVNANTGTPPRKRLRIPKLRQPNATPTSSAATRSPAAMSLGKQETVMTVTNPTPEEIRASLDGALAAYVESFPTPETRASALIKTGSYTVELSQYMPMLKGADDDFIDEVLTDWFAAGDEELKKMIWNASQGSEEIPLAKIAPAEEGPIFELGKMVDAAAEGSQRIAVLQKIGTYTTHHNDLLARIADRPAAEQEALVKQWVETGDGTHLPLKKAVVAANVAQRAAASLSVGERDAVDQIVGNASTHAGAALGGGGANNAPDSGIRRTIPNRSSAAGAGRRLRGDLTMPNQADSSNISPGSGPNDSTAGGGGAVNPASKIKRKGTTGGLGSVRGAETGAARQVDSAATNDKDGKGGKKKFREFGKMETLAVELVKIAPPEMLEAIGALDAEGQVLVCEEAAVHAANLMAWADTVGETLQKRDLDAATADWMGEDAGTVVMKKFVAEALATAEEIPLDLAKAIMSWEPPAAAGVTTLRSTTATDTRTAAPGVRVRQPYNLAA